MRRLRVKAAMLLVIALLALGSLALAQVGAPEINWWTVDGGGGTASGAGYLLSGTVGQPDAGVSSTGDGYALSGGFWGVGTTGERGDELYLPFFGR